MRTVTTFVSVVVLGLGLAVTPASTPAQAADIHCDNGPSDGPPPVSDSDYAKSYGRTNADQNKPITPDEALARGQDWLEAQPDDAPHIHYCWVDGYPDRHGREYRTDCSGFVSMAWHTDDPGYTAWTSILAVSHPIPWDDIQPGDAVHHTGHIELIETVERNESGEITYVGTMGFGSEPPHRNAFPGGVISLVMAGYIEPIRYDKMQMITDDMVREEIAERVPEPEPTIQPPNGLTLVQWDNNFYADVPDPWEQTVEMGPTGTQVRLHAEPVGFAWDFDDGSPVLETPHSGEKYPGEPSVRHPYTTLDTFEPSVDITWSNFRYDIVGDDEGWQDVTGEHTGDGPAADLRTVESLPRLGGRDGD